MTTTVLGVANAILAAGVITACAAVHGTTSVGFTVFAMLYATIYAGTAVLLPSNKNLLVRSLALLQLGAGLAIVAVSWIFIPTLWVVHGPLPARVVGVFLLFQALVLPCGVVLPAAILRTCGTSRRGLGRCLGGVALGVFVAATLLGALHARGHVYSVLLPLGIVPGRDAIVATLDGKTARLTTSELTRAKSYADVGELLSLLGRQLGADTDTVASHASLGRVRVDAIGEDVPLTTANVDRALREGANYLVRNIGADGRFRYLVDAPTNLETHDYNWPRHGGTTWALAQLARHLDDPVAQDAARRAADHLRTVLVPCGAERCIAGSIDNPDLGASALALLAFQAVGMHEEAEALASFLRSQVRADGELMHEFDLARGAPVDVQHPYYTGEAALALARTGDPRDAEVARRAVAHLVRRWSFFGSRYVYDEEHWTCQAAAVLHDAPGLALCRRWLGVQPRLHSGDAPFDVDGAYGFATFAPPSITPTASRTEGALALLDVAPDAALDAWVRRSLAFLLRHQLRTPGPLVAPAARGGFPATATDLEIRIDNIQHAALALLRWQVMERRGSR